MDNLLDCKICFRIYNEVKKPIMLPCGHTFCSSCVQALSPEEGFCPTCRKDIKTEFQQLPVNFAFLELALAIGKNINSSSASEEDKKTFTSDSFCMNHDNQVIVYWCKTSEEWLCEICVVDHNHEESPEFSNCMVTVGAALRLLKARVQKSHAEKLNEVQKMIEETESISRITNVLGNKLENLNVAKTSLQEKTDILDEQSKELKTKGLRYQFILTEFNLKLDGVCSVFSWIEAEKNLKKMEKMAEMNCDLMKLQQQTIEV